MDIYLFSMDGCPHCAEIKGKLNKTNVDYIELDVDEYPDAHDFLIENTGNDYLPSFMVLNKKDAENYSVSFLLPERDYQSIDDAVSLVTELKK